MKCLYVVLAVVLLSSLSGCALPANFHEGYSLVPYPVSSDYDRQPEVIIIESGPGYYIAH
jgi:hypothetical protein